MSRIIKNVISMKTYLILILSLFTFLELKAQDDTDQKTEQSGDDLAKELANPNATLGVLFTQFDYSRYSGDVPDAGQNGHRPRPGSWPWHRWILRRCAPGRCRG